MPPSPSGDFPQNYAPSRVSATCQAKDSRALYYIDLQVKQGDPEPDVCKLIVGLAGGISAGISGFLGPVASSLDFSASPERSQTSAQTKMVRHRVVARDRGSNA